MCSKTQAVRGTYPGSTSNVTNSRTLKQRCFKFRAVSVCFDFHTCIHFLQASRTSKQATTTSSQHPYCFIIHKHLTITLKNLIHWGRMNKGRKLIGARNENRFLKTCPNVAYIYISSNCVLCWSCVRSLKAYCYENCHVVIKCFPFLPLICT